MSTANIMACHQNHSGWVNYPGFITLATLVTGLVTFVFLLCVVYFIKLNLFLLTPFLFDENIVCELGKLTD